MSSINFGADAFGSSDYAPLPAGSYNANVFEVEIVQVKNGENAGKDQFKVQFKVAEGEFSNRRLFTYIPLYAGKASWKTVAFFKALGYEPKPGEPFTIPTPNELAGKNLGIKVKVVHICQELSLSQAQIILHKSCEGAATTLHRLHQLTSDRSTN